MPPNETRTIFDVAVNPANETKQIIYLFKDKVAALTTTLNSLHVSCCNMLLVYKVYWWTTIKYVAPYLNLSKQSNVLSKFHHTLPIRIKVNRNFQVALIPISPTFGGLGFRTMEL